MASKILTLKISDRNSHLANGRKDKIEYNKDSK